MDGIDYFIIKKLNDKYHLILLNIFNEMLSTQCYPDEWRNSFLHFIPKANGSSLRPIALTSCLGKLFETLVKGRLQWWVEYKNILPDSQHGFRQGHSCADGLVNMSLKIEEAFAEKKQVLAVFLDVKGAFDNVNIELLLFKLKEQGCSVRIIEYVKHISHNRRIHASCPGPDFRYAHRGVPQGGVLSPLLYIMYVSNIVNNVPKLITVSQFADDIALHIKFTSIKWATARMERAVQTICNNLKALKLELAQSKTELVQFNNKNIKPGETSIVVGDVEIFTKDKVKFLDGSKSTNSPSVGFAVVCQELDLSESVACSKQMSVFTAECAAINRALEIIANKKLNKTAIFTDSLSAAQSINTEINVRTNPFIAKAKNTYSKYLCTNPNAEINIYWIPAHKGIKGNEDAERLAKEAANAENVVVKNVPFTDLYEKLKYELYENLDSYIQQQGVSKGTRYMQEYYKKSKSPWFKKKKWATVREQVVMVNRVRANHYGLAESLLRVNIIRDPSCKCGAQYESLQHVLWECSLYREHRAALSRGLRALSLTPPCTEAELFAEPQWAAMHKLFIFLGKCHIRL
uniref:Reverse transcriptase domain-containing protein n=1 Tax=Trichogramma kaykai TaxID=54128 RepID=A0ABD2W5Y8_9HYME